MRKLKWICLSLVTLVSCLGYAAEEPTPTRPEKFSPANSLLDKPYMKIDRGNVAFSLLSFDFGHFPEPEYIASNVEYFIAPRLSLGLALSLWNDSNQKTLGFGPSLTYYFLTWGKLSAYTNLYFISYPFVHDTDWRKIINPKIALGANFNFTPWFGMGLRAEYETNLFYGNNNYHPVEYRLPFTFYF